MEGEDPGNLTTGMADPIDSREKSLFTPLATEKQGNWNKIQRRERAYI